MALIDRHRAPLVLLAAGLGSRYGGVKPVAPVGPEGEPLILLAVRQAAEAGFDEIVVVVGPATETEVAAALASAHTAVRISFARQVVPERRRRPWGTVDAVLAAVDSLGSRFVDFDDFDEFDEFDEFDGLVVANGDDLYGADAMVAAHRWIASAGDAVGAAVMFKLAKTMASVGGVSRAVPVVHDGRLVALEEHRDVHVDSGTILTGKGQVLAPETPVSMNLWCLRPTAVDALRVVHARFIEAQAGEPDAEFGLPMGVDELVRDGRSFDVLITDSRWHGVTWPDDVARVRAALIGGLV